MNREEMFKLVVQDYAPDVRNAVTPLVAGVIKNTIKVLIDNGVLIETPRTATQIVDTWKEWRRKAVQQILDEALNKPSEPEAYL